jgi:hypothetical protein
MKTLKGNLSRAAWMRALFVVMSGLFVLMTVDPAYAVGRVKWKSTTIQERTKNESWRLEMEIHLSKAPDIAHQSMRFEFTQVAEYERSLVDGREGPQERTVPLVNQEALIESVTVGFMDPGSGKIQSRTRFSFKVTRAHGYKAGKWKVKIKEAESGRQVGSEVTLNLLGENPVVDRRSITFHGKKKEKKEEEAPTEEPSDADGSSDSPSDSSYDDEPSRMDASEDEGQVPPSIEEKPGGGCHHTPHHSDTPFVAWVFALAFVGLISLRRQKKR